jgi:hypothetical protein
MNSLQAGLIAISVFVIALFAAWMWWQSWRSNRDERLRVEQRNAALQRERDAQPDAGLLASAAERNDQTRSEPVVHGVISEVPAIRATEDASPDGVALDKLTSDVRETRVTRVSDIIGETNARLNERSAPDASLDVSDLPEVESTSAPLSATATSMRVEPTVTHAEAAPDETYEPTSTAPKTVAAPTTLPLDDRLNVYAIVSATDGQAIDCQDFVPLADRSLAWGRVFRLSAWEYIDDLASGGAMQSLCLGMPLASRAGPVSTSDALNWKNEVSLIGGRLNLEVKFGGDVSVGERAAELDQFLAAVDVICVLYLVRKDNGAWSGTRLRGTLEANGFRLQSDGRFVYFEVESEMPIFSAVDGFERSFTPERLRTENVSALRLVFEASNVQNPVARFDVFRQTLRALARLLEADIKNHDGNVVGDAEFTQMRNDVQAGSSALAEAGIESGSPTAHALFR